MNALQFDEHMGALARAEALQKAILDKMEELLKPVEVNMLAPDENVGDKVKESILSVLNNISYNVENIKMRR